MLRHLLRLAPLLLLVALTPPASAGVVFDGSGWRPGEILGKVRAASLANRAERPHLLPFRAGRLERRAGRVGARWSECESTAEAAAPCCCH